MNDNLVLNGNKLEILVVENYLLSVFGHHDRDGTVEKMEHGGEILNGVDGQFQSLEKVYLRMGCSHHFYEILNGKAGDGEFLHVEHDDVFFVVAMEKWNDGDEVPIGNDGSHYDHNGNEGLMEGSELYVHFALHPWQSHWLNVY